ncbi:MAG: ABC transporter permease [Armatimonadetes bacterium]|nr:ABC transporter permease [Armatimonadota bacterium]
MQRSPKRLLTLMYSRDQSTSRTAAWLYALPNFFFRYGIVAGFVLLCLYFGTFTEEHRFVTRDNFINVANQIAINMILASGMTFVIIAAGIDLSVGAVLALCGVVGSMAMVELGRTGLSGELTAALGMAAGIGLGAVCGLFSGSLVAVPRLPAFIATLGMMMMARGLAFVVCGGRPVSPLPQAFTAIGQSPHRLVPIPVYIMTAVVFLAHLVLRHHTFGRYVYAVGGNEEAARLSGLPVRRIVISVYALSGALSGLGGMILASKLGSADPKSGLMYELDAIAAVVLGGTSLMGGRGTVLGTLIGALIIGVLNNGLSLMKVDQYWQYVLKGLVIIGAVLLDRLKRE